jgi:hypothetical protein
VAIIGAGGGRDVLSALSFGATNVTAIEINSDILRTVNVRFGDFTGHLDRDPRVHFVNDEARSYLARSPDRVDLLQISLIDTWAATAAGAFVMSENALYTREAWRIFLSRLTDTGVLSVSRWYSSDRPGEIYRLVALASASLADAGITNPAGHLLLVRNIRATRDREQPESVGTLLASRTAFTAADIERLQKVSRDLNFEVVMRPDRIDDPVLKALTDGRDIDAYTRDFPINYHAADRQQPVLLPDAAAARSRGHQPDARRQEPAQHAGGLRPRHADGHGAGAWAGLSSSVPRMFVEPARATWRGSLVPGVLSGRFGLGFMLVEISLMQRLILLLGHPTYGLSVVLFALLLGSGAGSFLTRNVTVDDAPDAAKRRLMALVVAGRSDWARDAICDRRARDVLDCCPRVRRRQLALRRGAADGAGVSARNEARCRSRAVDAVAVGNERRDVGLCLRPRSRHRLVMVDLGGVLDRRRLLRPGARGCVSLRFASAPRS